RKMTNRKRLGLLGVILPTVLVGVPAWLIWRAVRQERLDRALLSAVQKNDPQTVTALLTRGADPDARLHPQAPLSLRQWLLALLWSRRAVSPSEPGALTLAIRADL